MNKEPGGQAKTDAYDRTVKSTGLFGGVQGLVLLIGIVRTKLVSILLGPTGFGINESFNRTLNLVKSTTDLGISFSAVRNVSECIENDRQARESILVTRSWALLTAIIGMLLCAALSPLFSIWAFEGGSGYTLSFILLSPVVAFSAVNGGEMAILKAARQLRQIALSQLLTVVLTFCISIPLFWKLGLMGLVPSLVLVSAASAAVTCSFSFKVYRYRAKPFSLSVLRSGTGMIRLGIFFTIASFFGSGAFSIIANWLMKHGNAEIAGIYSAGYLLVSYLGMFVFSAMESDYFPRLSAVNSDSEKVSELVNLQADVAVLLMSPMVVGFMVFLNLIVSLFLSDKFLEAVPMAQLAVMSLVFKAMTQPMAYISLAKGDSKTFLLQELLFDVFLVASVILLFEFWGLEMTGLALLLAGIFDFLMVGIITHRRYGFSFGRKTLFLMLAQLPLVIAAYASSVWLDGPARWAAGIALLMASAWFSIAYLAKHTSFIRTLIEKVRKKLGL